MQIVATSGTIARLTVVRPLATRKAVNSTPATAAPTAIRRNKSMSPNRLGSMTTMKAPISEPERVLRPP